MWRLAHALVLTVSVFTWRECFAQEDCDEEDLEIIGFEGRSCDNNDVGPRVCGQELLCGGRGPCGTSGRQLFCSAGRCVAENADNLGYPCKANGVTCGGGSQCVGVSGDVDRCILTLDPRNGDIGCGAPYKTCLEGYSCNRFCGPSGCGSGSCINDVSASLGEECGSGTQCSTDENPLYDRLVCRGSTPSQFGGLSGVCWGRAVVGGVCGKSLNLVCTPRELFIEGPDELCRDGICFSS